MTFLKKLAILLAIGDHMNIIKFLREKQGYSQEELSKEIQISRQTLINYESGRTTCSAISAQKIAEFFDVSVEDILNNRIPVEPSYKITPAQTIPAASSFRISIPQENINKFKEVFLYIINKIGAKANVGQTVLYKLLYFIDFDYYEKYEEQLIGAKYIKNTFGPTPVDFAKIVRKMQQDGDCEEIVTAYFSKEQRKYLPHRKANLDCLSAREIKHIDEVIKKYGDKSAKELSALTHKDVPWLSAPARGIIDYETVFYRTPETSVREIPDD